MSYEAPTERELERLATYGLIREGERCDRGAVHARMDELRDGAARRRWLAEMAPEVEVAGARKAFRRILDSDGLPRVGAALLD